MFPQLGLLEMLIVMGVAVLLFGKRLPDFALGFHPITPLNEVLEGAPSFAFCAKGGLLQSGTAVPLLFCFTLVFLFLLSLFSLCPLCSSLCELCVTVLLLFLSYSPSKISPALIFPVAKCAINSRFAARKSYCPSSRGSTHSTRSNAPGRISASANAAAKK